MIWVFCCCLALGAIVGFAAGLLGIGGGLIIVPVLLYVLPFLGFDAQVVPHVAIATSLAAIILTSCSASFAHSRHKNLDKALLKKFAIGMFSGALTAGFIADSIPADWLQRAFAIFVLLMAVQMLYPLKPKERQQPSVIVVIAATYGVGLVAGLMGVGGGVLLIPLLTLWGLEMRYAIGASSVMGLLVACAGSFGYITSGATITHLPQGTLGYIYLPALFGIVLSSILLAPVGVKAASMWPTPRLKKIFAGLLIVVGMNLMLR